MKRIENGWELTRQSWAALRAHPQLLIFPLISLLGMIAVTVIFLIPIAGAGIFDAVQRSAQTGEAEFSSGQMTLSAVVGFLYSFVAYIVVIYSNVALVGAAMKLVRGETATVRDGLAIANARLGKIVIYAFISAVVGTIARAISQSGRDSKNVVIAILAAIVGSIIQGVWSLVVFFAIPIIVVEDLGVIDSLKRSAALFKQTWGETFTGQAAIGILGCVGTIILLAVGGGIIALAALTQSLPVIIIAIVVVVLLFVAVGLLNGAMNGVFQASLYNYATKGTAGTLIETRVAETAFGTPLIRPA